MIAVAIMGVAWMPWAGAETLVDPTLPPAIAGMPDAAGNGLPAGPVLQSVMLGAGRRAALIGGRMVAVGEKFGEATLVRVTEQGAVLRNPDGSLQTLRMHPAVEKKVLTQKPANKAAVRNKKRDPVSPVSNSR